MKYSYLRFNTLFILLMFYSSFSIAQKADFTMINYGDVELIIEEIDLSKPENRTFYFPEESKTYKSSLFITLLKNIKNGKIKNVYRDSNLEDKLSLSDLEKSLIKIDTLDIGFEQLADEGKIYPEYLNHYEINSSHIKKYRTLGFYIENKKTNLLEYQLLAIAPIAINIDFIDVQEENNQELISLFWLFYPDARFVLQNNFPVKQDFNSKVNSYDVMLQNHDFTYTNIDKTNIDNFFNSNEDENLSKILDFVKFSYKKQPSPTKKPVDKDKFVSKIITEEISIENKFNKHLFNLIDDEEYDFSEKHNTLYDKLIKYIKNGKITEVYANSNLEVKLSYSDIEQRISRKDTLMIGYEMLKHEDEISPEYISYYELHSSEIKKFRIKGFYTQNKITSELDYHLLAIAPLGPDIHNYWYQEDLYDGENPIFELFWIFYPKAKEIFSNEIVKKGLFRKNKTFDDILSNREFESEIIVKDDFRDIMSDNLLYHIPIVKNYAAQFFEPY